MQEYSRNITITNKGLPAKAVLKVIRLPESWYGVIWESENRHLSISQDKTAVNGGHEHMTDEQFLGRVQLVAGFSFGVEFEFDAVMPSKEDNGPEGEFSYRGTFAFKESSKPTTNDTDAAKCARIFNDDLFDTARFEPPYVVWNVLWYRCDFEKVRHVPVKYLWRLAEALTARVSERPDFLKPNFVADLEFDIPDWEPTSPPPAW